MQTRVATRALCGSASGRGLPKLRRWWVTGATMCVLAACGAATPEVERGLAPRADAPLIFSPRLDGTPAPSDPAKGEARRTGHVFDPLAAARADGAPTFSNTWFELHEENWTRVLAPFKGRAGLRYLEVGVYEGQSLLWMFENILTDDSASAVALDLFAHEGLEARFRDNLVRAGLDTRVETHVGLSNVLLRELTGANFDIIYIDASHTGADVLRDTVLAWDLLKTNGVLIFDDFSYAKHMSMELRPGPAVLSFVSSFAGELEVLHHDWQFIVRKTGRACGYLCSALGPYAYHWVEEPGGGWLEDPRTGGEVELSEDERKLVEELLRSRSAVTGELWLPSKMRAEGEALVARLGL